MNVQEAEEFKTSKFFCKTDFGILYRNFVNVGMEVKEMIKDVLNKRETK